MGRALTNKNSIQEETKSTLESRNTCYPSVQDLLSSSLRSKNLKFKIYRTIILHIEGGTSTEGVWEQNTRAVKKETELI